MTDNATVFVNTKIPNFRYGGYSFVNHFLRLEEEEALKFVELHKKMPVKYARNIHVYDEEQALKTHIKPMSSVVARGPQTATDSAQTKLEKAALQQQSGNETGTESGVNIVGTESIEGVEVGSNSGSDSAGTSATVAATGAATDPKPTDSGVKPAAEKPAKINVNKLAATKPA